MKCFYVFLIATVLHFNCYSQTASTCTPASFFLNVYKNDIADVALKRIYAIQSPDTSSIEIPAIDQDSIQNGMAAIFNLDTLLEADSVFKIYCIHAYPEGFVHSSISVRLDTNIAWTHQWAVMNMITGYADLDNFMNRYGYRLTNYYDYRNTAYLSPSRAVNDRAFVDSLVLFTGIYLVYFNPTGGTPHGIITYKRDSVSTYGFYMGWGDCPSGCFNGKTWTYKVDDLCNVTLLSVNLDMRIPVYNTPSNCFANYYVNIPRLLPTVNITAFPNPVTNILHISITGSQEEFSYLLTDICGRIVNSGAAGNETLVNIHGLSSGMYFLQVINSKGTVYRQKIIKE